MKNDQSDAGVNDQSDAGVNDQSDAGVNDQSDAGVIEKYCYDNSTSNCGTYGGLYQWNEMMVQGICPAGWHLPTDAEWCKLEQEVDSSIKCNSLHWRGVDGGTELKQGGNSGFQALLAGDRGYDGSFYDLDLYANFWTSSEYDSYVWIRRLSVSNATVYRYVANKSSGVSVRCLKGY
ncbi:MAG: hypothetical protein GY762_14415 [Proteobacteria bacterium]|nr:hypothetical protein [Pseudomonadota bacterium]